MKHWNPIAQNLTISSNIVLNEENKFKNTTSEKLSKTKYASNTSERLNNTKYILFWTTWYGMDLPFGYGYEFGDSLFKNCSVSNCIATNNRSMLNEHDAIMFHTWYDLKMNDLPWYRFPHQRYIMYRTGPPTFLPKSVLSPLPPHFFNWTFTPRRISDIHSNQNGDLRFIPHSLDRQLKGKYEDEENLENFHGINITGKSIMVAWFASHQSPEGIPREDYVHELQKYVRVDVYGARGNFSCPISFNFESKACDELLKKDYLFYLAFENSFCPEYVTEKLFRPLRAGAVPIVLGGAHYSQYAPPHSYIKALDYNSPKELADYLIQLEKNRKLYARYFEWRKYFKVETRPNDSWCQLCAMLNDKSLPPKSYENISKWWYDTYPCENIQFKF
jgi:alpha-1,3-fucosyltransferase